MPLTNISAYRQAGYTIDDEDIDDNADIEISKLGTQTLKLVIPATCLTPNGAGCSKINLGVFGAYTMPDANSSDLTGSFALPDEWDSGNITVRVFWATTAILNNMKLSATLKSTVAGGTTASEETVTATDTANGVTNTINDTTLVFAAADFTKGDVIGINILRNPADAADTLATDLKIFAIAVEFTGRA